MKPPPPYSADLVCAASLLLLVGATGAVYALGAGALSTAGGLIIAGGKALLIGLIFMDLRSGSGRSRLFAAAGLYWGALLLALTLADVLTRQWG